jgi:tetratricopeptide (TPR) repeat protein
MLEFNGKDMFDDREKIILDELALAIQWDRPSLILVVYRSEYVKNLVQTSLAKALRESGQVVFYYNVDKFHYDIPIELLGHPNQKQAVFFISGLRWGGGRGYSNAYRALNMHREILVEGSIKAIFWLTKIEVKQLTHFSPDFWAFRHKVVEFFDLPKYQKNKPLEKSKSTLHNLYTKSARDFQVWTNTAEMLYEQGCNDEAIQNFRKALRKYPDETAVSLQIAEIYLSMGRLSEAGGILRKVTKDKTTKGTYLRELDRLIKLANSIQHTSGGVLEQTT